MRRQISLSAQDIDILTISCLISWAWVSQRHSWSPLLHEWLKHATLDSTRSQVHITSSSPTHLNPQKQRKPTSDSSETPTSSHSHALHNQSPPSGGHQGFSPADSDDDDLLIFFTCLCPVHILKSHMIHWHLKNWQFFLQKACFTFCIIHTSYWLLK